MIMNVVAINTSPRVNWNTDLAVKEAAKGAASAGAEIQYFDLYRLKNVSGCVSCFGCKRPPHEGHCVKQDDLTAVLEAIREADGVIIGTPNYLGQPSAGFMQLFERLCYQNITYRKEDKRYVWGKTPFLFIMTSNFGEEAYKKGPYAHMMRNICGRLSVAIGPLEVFIVGDTLQVADYSQYNWTLFDPEAKKKRHETVFPKEMEKAFRLGTELVSGNWLATHRMATPNDPII
ncbi:MAG: flavodoxin family protein [Clostridia bacterium]|nr:flavodoxin family protein [Clostridia bacterium]